MPFQHFNVDELRLGLASYVRLACGGRGVQVREQQGELLLQLLGTLPVRLQQEGLVVQRQSVPGRREAAAEFTRAHEQRGSPGSVSYEERGRVADLRADSTNTLSAFRWIQATNISLKFSFSQRTKTP